MRKVNTNCLYPLIASVILIFALSKQMFIVPPLGKLLDPFIGAVQNADDDGWKSSLLTMNKIDLAEPVRVFFDDRQVPHIYAQNVEDLYFTQGYVTAHFRLWQMDFLSYSSAGRLSELFSEKEFFDYDRNQRRIGILEAAKESLKFIEKDSVTLKALTAYTKGVNAYIKELSYRKMPLEYKLLDYEPEPWSNLKSVLILKSMANTLSGYEEDLFMSKMMLALGEEDFNKLYPDYYGHSTPVMNKSKPDESVALAPIKKPDYLNYGFLVSNSETPPTTYNPRLGSNSWAVSGKKTKSGFPILANDPHLNLSLPSIWIEMQLSAPGMNVYGVSIPGTPAIIIGFNENIAWGLTNGSDDVKDWYKLKITSDYKKYELDGKWLDLGYRLEEIKRKGQTTFYDTVFTTVHGPIVNTKSFPGKDPEMIDLALRWELHQPSDEFLTFIKLNAAKDYKDYKEAIRTYSCPIQNFTFASKDTIAITHQGKMTLKEPSEGKFILDGTTSAHLFTKHIPVDSLPQLVNPECQYVESANQRPTYPDYPYYYNGYFSETRSNRIKQILESENDFDVSRMEALQLDNTNAFSAEALPVLLSRMNESHLNEAQRKALASLSTWKGVYSFDDKNARLYELWWRNIREYTWDELKSYPFYTVPPENYILLDLIQKDPSNTYFDKAETAKRENATDIITEAFIVASNDFNAFKKEGRVKWSDFHKVNINHLAQLPAFSWLNVPIAGQSEAVNATSRNWGPSWRMIVELGVRPKAYGVYPGGQSGNPGSPNYDNFINNWKRGKYFSLNFFMSPDEAKAKASHSWILNGNEIK
jgi:penicillin G amidase